MRFGINMLHLLIGIVFAVEATSARFSCPPAEMIYPCTCVTEVREMVRCDDVYNLASVRDILEDHFTETIPSLYFTNVHSLSLPSHALGNLSPKKLILHDSNIRRIEKDAFEGQSSLRLLMLTQDRLESVPTETLQHLSLKTLSLAGNFLMRIPDGSFNVLDNLKYLVLTKNRISEIEKNVFPKNLDTLAISHNLLSTFNGSLQSLERLQELDATDNRLANIKGEFEGLFRLKFLRLDRNYISDISDSFTDLTSITHLSLSGNQIQDVGKALMNLHQLKHLDLSNNFITELHWMTFEKLKNIKVLNLSRNFLKDICPIIKPLKSLSDLKLSGLGLKSLLPDCFQNMKGLKTLDLSHNQLTNTDAVSRHPLPSLMFLYLNHNQLTAFKYEMKYAKNLRELDISFNNFSSMKQYYLSHNKDLSTLRMEGNPWECSEQTMLMLTDLEQRGVEMQGRPDC